MDEVVARSRLVATILLLEDYDDTGGAGMAVEIGACVCLRNYYLHTTLHLVILSGVRQDYPGGGGGAQSADFFFFWTKTFLTAKRSDVHDQCSP